MCCLCLCQHVLKFLKNFKSYKININPIIHKNKNTLHNIKKKKKKNGLILKIKYVYCNT